MKRYNNIISINKHYNKKNIYTVRFIEWKTYEEDIKAVSEEDCRKIIENKLLNGEVPSEYYPIEELLEVVRIEEKI
tara:strand:- start:319 stop:546 length:228 start_codon:yes stop_codon:yes gene_type:complete